MESFLSRYRNPLVLLAVVLAQMLGLAIQVRRPAEGKNGTQTRLVRYWVVSVFSPFERLFLFSGHGISHTWDNYIDLRHVRQQNQQLLAELNRMRLEQASLAEAARQDQRLEKLLGFQQQYVSKTVAAHVIGTSGTDMSRVLLIDKGSHDGLRADLPVITPDGVVGKIRDVFPHTAQVLEINDPTSGLGVILTQTRLRGILRGNATGQIEIVDVLPDERIQTGEQVITSGGDQVYPRGLPVGTVERVVSDPDRNPFVAVLLKPAVNLSRLDEVLVVTQVTDTEPAAMQQDVTTSEQKAADILSQRLPGALPPQELGPDGKPLDSNAPPPPVRPPVPLHPDRFTPGAAPPAADLTPDAAYPNHVFPARNQPAAPAPNVTTKPEEAKPAATAPPATVIRGSGNITDVLPRRVKSAPLQPSGGPAGSSTTPPTEPQE